MPSIPLIVVIVLAIAIIFLLVKSSQTWSWLHICSVLAVFTIGIFAAMAASQVLKTRTAWIKCYAQNVDLKAEAEKAHHAALFGPANAIKIAKNSLRGTASRLELEFLRGGRIWRAGEISIPAPDDTELLHEVVFADDSDAPIFKDMILFGFSEHDIDGNDESEKQPTQFLGIFKVTGSANNVVTIKNVFMANRFEIENPSTTWAFFEKMPLDDRDIFKINSGLVGDEFDIDAYRQQLETVYFPQDRINFSRDDDLLAIDAGSYQNLINEYAFDGLPFNQINGWLQAQGRPNFEPPLEHQKVELQFNDTTDSFRVDTNGNISSDGAFVNGQAVEPALHLKRDVVFKKGDTLIVDRLSGETGYEDVVTRRPPLIETEDAEVINTFYVRPLRDYPYLLQTLEEQIDSLWSAKDRVDQQIADIGHMQANTTLQENRRADIIQKLNRDILNLIDDGKVIAAALAQRLDEKQSKREQLRAYHQSIMDSYQALRDKYQPSQASAQRNPPAVAATK